MASSDKGVVKRAIVTPDKHAPIHDRKAISVVKQAIEIIDNCMTLMCMKTFVY